MRIYDLFCGAGGFSLGLEMAGHRVVGGADADADSVATFADAHPAAVAERSDVKALDGHDARRKTGGVDVLVGGPPCQGFSFYNHKRGENDPRTGLVREYLRLVSEMRPRWIVMENVLGMAETAGGQVIRDVHAALGEFGYDSSHAVLRAEDYGVPQMRRRVFFVARAESAAAFLWPEPAHGGARPNVTVGEAIMDLPRVEAGESGDGLPYAEAADGDFRRAMREGATEMSGHAAPKLGAVNARRLAHIPEGGSWRDIPMELLPEGMKKARRSDHTRRYGRLARSGLSPTVLTKADPHWTSAFHPVSDRVLTPRECARLQGIPDRVRFRGRPTSQYRQIGNAVPPPLAAALGRAIAEAEGEA